MARNDTVMAAPPSAVFSVLEDPKTYEYWVVGNKKVRRIDPDWPAPGSEFHHTVGVGPLARRDKTCVTEVEEARYLVLHARAMPAGVAEVRLELVPEGSGTRVSMIERPIGGPALRVPRQVMDFLIRVRNAESLRRLRRLAEDRAAGSG